MCLHRLGMLGRMTTDGEVILGASPVGIRVACHVVRQFARIEYTDGWKMM